MFDWLWRRRPVDDAEPAVSRENFRQYLTQLRDHYAVYHERKERVAWTATTLFLGAALALLGAITTSERLSWWIWTDRVIASGIVLLVSLGALLTYTFIVDEFKNRHIAADFVEACGELLVRLVDDSFPLSDTQLKPERYRHPANGRYYTQPAAVWEHVMVLSRQALPRLLWSRLSPVAAIVALNLAAVVLVAAISFHLVPGPSGQFFQVSTAMQAIASSPATPVPLPTATVIPSSTVIRTPPQTPAPFSASTALTYFANLVGFLGLFLSLLNFAILIRDRRPRVSVRIDSDVVLGEDEQFGEYPIANRLWIVITNHSAKRVLVARIECEQSSSAWRSRRRRKIDLTDLQQWEGEEKAPTSRFWIDPWGNAVLSADADELPVEPKNAKRGQRYWYQVVIRDGLGKNHRSNRLVVP